MPRKKAESAQMTKEKVVKAAARTKEKENNKAVDKPKEAFAVVGRRKGAVARVRLELKKGELLVNEKPMEEYFPGPVAKKVFEEPLRVVNRLGQLSGSVKVEGGGKVGQLGAVTHGIARALIELDETFRPILSKRKLLTRDSRVKERRKYGHAGKARKMKQSPKR